MMQRVHVTEMAVIRKAGETQFLTECTKLMLPVFNYAGFGKKT
jgi:hypothetical protein